jgi:hypothetical protein
VRTLLDVRTEVERRAGDTSERSVELKDYREAIKVALGDDISQSREGPGRPAGNMSGTHILAEQHNAASILARLKRDDPELAQQVIHGKITANAAARQKGWRYPRVELRNPSTVAAPRGTAKVRPRSKSGSKRPLARGALPGTIRVLTPTTIDARRSVDYAASVDDVGSTDSSLCGQCAEHASSDICKVCNTNQFN